MLFLPGDGLQYLFGEAAAPPGGPGIEVLHVSPAETLFPAAPSMLSLGLETTHQTDVAQSPASYTIQGTLCVFSAWIIHSVS